MKSAALPEPANTSTGVSVLIAWYAVFNVIGPPSSTRTTTGTLTNSAQCTQPTHYGKINRELFLTHPVYIAVQMTEGLQDNKLHLDSDRYK